MGRLLWIVGEVVFGLLVSGGVAAVAVPIMMRAGWEQAPWAPLVLWAVAGLSIAASVVVGERAWKRRHGPRAA